MEPSPFGATILDQAACWDANPDQSKLWAMPPRRVGGDRRALFKLLGLARKYGPGRLDASCETALDAAIPRSVDLAQNVLPSSVRPRGVAPGSSAAQ
jgi:hypothetical protein